MRLAAASLLAVAGCSASQEVIPPPPGQDSVVWQAERLPDVGNAPALDLDTVDVAMLTAVWRYTASHPYQLELTASAFCLSIDRPERDPSAQALEAVSRWFARPVYVASRCPEDIRFPGTVMSPEGATGAVRLWIRDIRCVAPDRCLVRAGYSTSGLSGAAYEYALERREHEWQVTAHVMRAIA